MPVIYNQLNGRLNTVEVEQRLHADTTDPVVMYQHILNY